MSMNDVCPSCGAKGMSVFYEVDKIPVHSLDASYMVNDRVGYVKLARFSHTSVEEFESAMKQLREEGMKDMILDLSGNGGGWLPVAVELADHFLSGSKEIVRT